MIATIARKEFTELLRDGRFRWSVALVLALLAVAVAVGVTQQRTLVAQQRAAQAEELHRWYHQPGKNPQSGGHYGFHVFKPRLAPGFIDPGVEPFTGIGTWLEAHYQHDMAFRPAADATPAQRFGDLTVALVLQMMLPLVIVLLAFNTFAGERERGTLRSLLALGLRPRDLVAGKLLGVLAALAVALAPVLLVGAGLVAFTDARASADRFAVMAAAYGAYLVIFALIALGVSARAPSGRFALIALLGFWSANCLFAPRALGDLGAWIHPLPDPVRMRADIKVAAGDPHGAPTQHRDHLDALMRQHAVARTEDLPINIRGLSLQFGEEHSQAAYDRHLGALFPLLGLQSLSTALAGTDLPEHLDFTRAAELHRRLIQKLMNGAVMDRPLQPGEVYIAGREMWARVPPFAHAPASLGTVLARNLVPLAALGAWLAAALWFALRSARHLRAA